MLRILRVSSSLLSTVLFTSALTSVFVRAAASLNPQQSSESVAPAAQQAVTLLEPGKAVEREISGKEAHKYRIALKPGEYAGVVVEQRGIDVVVYIVDASGKVIGDFDSESRIEGEERAGLVAEPGADYSLSVRAKYSRAPAGHYTIRLAEVRPATEQDRWLLEAHKLSTDGQRLSDAGK